MTRPKFQINDSPCHSLYGTRSIPLTQAMEFIDWYLAYCPISDSHRDANVHNHCVFGDLIVLSERCHPHQADHSVNMDIMLPCTQEAMLFKLVWG
jgi:hypothetical protein